MGNDGVVGMPKISACQDRCGMDRHGLHDDHGRAAYRALGVVGDVPVGRQTFDGHIGGMRAKHDAVPERLPAQGRGCKQAREYPAFHSQSPLTFATATATIAAMLRSLRAKCDILVAVAELHHSEVIPAVTMPAHGRLYGCQFGKERRLILPSPT
jgi:hypothetical protein